MLPRDCTLVIVDIVASESVLLVKDFVDGRGTVVAGTAAVAAVDREAAISGSTIENAPVVEMAAVVRQSPY